MWLTELHFHKQKHFKSLLAMLSVLNVASIITAINLVIILNPEDRISIRRGSALTTLGLVYFMTLFEVLTMVAMYTAAGARFRRKYSLCAGEILDIINKVVSAIQAAFSCVTGAIVCLCSCTRDFMRSSHYMSEAYAWFGAAYFFYDIWSMYLVHLEMNAKDNVSYIKSKIQRAKNGAPAVTAGDGKKQPGTSFLDYCRHEPVILFHHLFIGGFGFLVIVYLRGNLGDCTFGFVYLMELSTPFVSLRGILARMRLKEARVYLINGLVMLATFFVCRVISLPCVMYMYSRVSGMTYIEAVKSLPTGCKISISILMMPQLYWFYLMSSGAVKLFLGKSSNKSASMSADKLAVSADKSASKSANKLASLSSGDADKRS